MRYNTAMQRYFKYFTPLLLGAPFVAHAQGLQDFLRSFSTFLSIRIIPFLIGLAFLFFAYNAIRYFVVQGSSEDGREKAKALALYSVLAIVFIIIFWGIINLLVNSLGFAGGRGVDPYNDSDYINPTPG